MNPGAKTTRSRRIERFRKNIVEAGVSASSAVSDFNLAMETLPRDKAALVVNTAVYVGLAGTPPPVPTGRTARLNRSTLTTFGPGVPAKRSSLVAKLA